LSKKIKEVPPERWRPSFLLTTHQKKNTFNGERRARRAFRLLSRFYALLSPSLCLCMVISGRWPPAVPGGFVDVVGVPALQVRSGAFDAPPLILEGAAKRVTDLPLFNKKQIRFLKPQKSACTPWCVWLCLKSPLSMAVTETPVF
jgi:hypothetical protein